MENWFSDNALAKLLQTSPELAQYVQAFNDLSDQLPEETGTKVGVFILAVGQGLMFVPVIAKADSIFPIDSIFDDTSKKFYPLSKNIVGGLIAQATVSMGKSTKIPRTVNRNPDVSEFINPPRTGKFSYASAGGRLTDFLAALPDHLKASVSDRFIKDKAIYTGLHSLFDLSDILKALKPSVGGITHLPNAPVSVITEGDNLTPAEITAILADGYAVRGSHATTRIAIPKQDYDSSVVQGVTNSESAAEVDLACKDGITRPAYLPVKSPQWRGTAEAVALFANGDYAEGLLVSTGPAKTHSETIKKLFQWSAPILPKDLATNDRFALFDVDHTLIGLFEVDHMVRSAVGEIINVTNLTGGGKLRIISSRNVAGPVLANPDEIWVKSFSPVIRLRNSVSHKMETSPLAASNRACLKDLAMLGESLDLGFDGIEFSINGKPEGSKDRVARTMIVDMNFDPNDVAGFLKQAEQKKHITLYISKEASAQMPEYGEYAGTPEIANKNAPGANIGEQGTQSLSMAMGLQDAPAVEATIISELLQSDNLPELIGEYLPDIEECMDRLGRTLFICRVNTGKISEKMSTESLSGLISNLKGVYKNLGESYFKLQRVISTGI